MKEEAQIVGIILIISLIAIGSIFISTTLRDIEDKKAEILLELKK